MSVWRWFYLDKGGFFPVFCLASLTFTRWWFVLCFVFNAFFFSIQSSPCFLFYEGVLRPGSDCHFFARNRANCFELYMFYFFYFFFRKHQSLVLCLYKCFNHFHGGRILYLCSCTILFFFKRKTNVWNKPKSRVEK